MNKFPKRPDLVAELRDVGESFLHDCRKDFSERDRSADDNYRFCQLITGEDPKSVGHNVIARLVDVPSGQSQVRAMHQPVFTWNGSIREPVITNTENRLVNTSECFPPLL